MNLELKILDLGKTTYQEAWKIQKELFEKRKKNTLQDTLILTEHNPTITFGTNESWNVLHVSKKELKELNIEFFERTPRGGGAAYLGPGQLIGYTILDIFPHGGVLSFMKKLEETMILTAKDFGINIDRYDVMNPTTEKLYRATWYRNNGSAYVLCTKGIGISPYKKGLYTHHGFSLNVNNEPSHFHLIDPCGFPLSEVKPISMQELFGKRINIEEVKSSVIKNFTKVFNYEVKYG